MTGWRIGYCGGPVELVTAMATMWPEHLEPVVDLAKAATVALNGSGLRRGDVLRLPCPARSVVAGLNTLPASPAARWGTFYVCERHRGDARRRCVDVPFAEF